MMNKTSHWDGNKYEKIALPQYEINKAFLSKHKFKGNENILDIGCGDGATTAMLAKCVPFGSIQGIDASESMIATARNKNKLSNVSFDLLNIENINFQNQFDLGTCFFCMQWIQDKKKAFKKIFNALKHQGIFMMIVPLPQLHLQAIRKKLMQLKRWRSFFIDYHDPLLYINDSDYEKYSEEAKLTLLNYDVKDSGFSFKDYNAYFLFMFEMTPHLTQLPCEETKKDFLHELLEECIKIYPPKQNGGYELKLEFLHFKAQKLIGEK